MHTKVLFREGADKLRGTYIQNMHGEVRIVVRLGLLPDATIMTYRLFIEMRESERLEEQERRHLNT